MCSVSHKRQTEQCAEPNAEPFGLEMNDPWLAELVRHADAGKPIIETVDFSQTPAHEDHSAMKE